MGGEVCLRQALGQVGGCKDEGAKKKGEGKSGKDELGPSLRSKSNSGGREQSFRPYVHQGKYLQMKMWNIGTNLPVKLKHLNISDFVTSAYSIYLCHLELIQSMQCIV